MERVIEYWIEVLVNSQPSHFKTIEEALEFAEKMWSRGTYYVSFRLCGKVIKNEDSKLKDF